MLDREIEQGRGNGMRSGERPEEVSPRGMAQRECISWRETWGPVCAVDTGVREGMSISEATAFKLSPRTLAFVLSYMGNFWRI